MITDVAGGARLLLDGNTATESPHICLGDVSTKTRYPPGCAVRCGMTAEGVDERKAVGDDIREPLGTLLAFETGQRRHEETRAQMDMAMSGTSRDAAPHCGCRGGPRTESRYAESMKLSRRSTYQAGKPKRRAGSTIRCT